MLVKLVDRCRIERPGMSSGLKTDRETYNHMVH